MTELQTGETEGVDHESPEQSPLLDEDGDLVLHSPPPGIDLNQDIQQMIPSLMHSDLIGIERLKNKKKNFDFEFGFNMYKLSKGEAEKVANVLASNMSKKIGSRYQ